MNNDQQAARRLLWAIWTAVAISIVQFPVIELRTSPYHRAVHRFTDPDLLFVTGGQTRTIQERYTFHLQLATLHGDNRLEVTPATDLPREHLYGLGQFSEVVLETYEPVLSADQARQLRRESDFEGSLPEGRQYVIVADPVPPDGNRTLRTFLHDETLFVVDQSVLDRMGIP